MGHQFSMLDDIYREDAFISSDAFLRHSQECEDCEYHRSDAIFRALTWRDNHIPALIGSTFKHKKKNLLLGHSDQETKVHTALLLRILGFNRVFGINVVKFGHLSHPIPIGLTNGTLESDFHRLFGNNELLMLANNVDFLSESNGLVYGCFSTTTNPKERLPLVKVLTNTKHTFEEPSFTVEGRIKYLENLRRYAFTACPVGNGVDTHRLWEVLYMGGIPIIKKNKILESMLVDLPFVLVNNWEQLTDDSFLRKSWEKVQNKQSFNFAKLKLDYWINLIHAR